MFPNQIVKFLSFPPEGFSQFPPMVGETYLANPGNEIINSWHTHKFCLNASVFVDSG